MNQLKIKGEITVSPLNNNDNKLPTLTTLLARCSLNLNLKHLQHSFQSKSLRTLDITFSPPNHSFQGLICSTRELSPLFARNSNLHASFCYLLFRANSLESICPLVERKKIQILSSYLKKK